ncbi:MAG: patatin-like phospholipase family protein [Bacteroidales bacterium]|nr:patatin-like phospholipase family protein [Bacteroidales bacterium]
MVSTKKYRLGIALGGGGAKGFAHLGVLKALEDFGLKPDVFAGCSAGSIVGAFYAAGFSTDDLLRIFSEIKFSSLGKVALPTTGLFNLKKFETFLEQQLPYSRIEDLPTPCIITATSLDTYDAVAFTEGPLAKSITASCSLPVVFQPTEIDGCNYVDGGVLHNLPAFALRDCCDYVLGVVVSPLNKSPFKKSIADIAYRSYRLMTTRNTHADMLTCDAVISVDAMKGKSTFGFEYLKENAKAGYFAAMKVLHNSPLLKQLRDEKRK